MATAKGNFEDFRRKLKSTSEKIKRRKVKQLLRRKAIPIRDEMRNVAYSELASASKKSSKKVLRKASKGGKDWEAYNLSGSINIFASRGNKNSDTVRVYVGVRSTNKNPSGAPYAMPFLTGVFKSPNPKWKDNPPKLDFVRKTSQRINLETLEASKAVQSFIKREIGKNWR